MVGWDAEVHLDSLPVRIRLASIDEQAIEALEAFVASWCHVGTLGGFGGTVHDATINGFQDSQDGVAVFEVVLDLGTASEAALDAFLSGLRGLKIVHGLDVEEVLLGYNADGL